MNHDNAINLINILKKLLRVTESKVEQAAIRLNIVSLENTVKGIKYISENVKNKTGAYQDIEFIVDNNNFQRAVAKTFELEGFYSDHKHDPGGQTMYGISSKWNPEVADKIKNKTLTIEEAKDIYKRNYWGKIYKVNDLPFAIAWILFDAKVHGTLESVKDIQRWINYHFKSNLVVDGVFGPATYKFLPKEKEDLVDLLVYLSGRAQSSARSAAVRVKNQQEKMGLPVYDYTAGFTNRLMERYSFAKAQV